jgi:hypothetical protein
MTMRGDPSTGATPDEAKALAGEMHDAGSAEARFFTGDLRDATHHARSVRSRHRTM